MTTIRDFAYEALLLGNASDGIVGADGDTRITYWGKGAERIFGFSANEALGRTTRELLRPEYAPGEREKILDDIARLGSAVSTLRVRHKNGTEVVTEVNSTELRDPRGKRTGYVVIYRDVTERSRIRQALQEANERLRLQAEELGRKEATLRGILNATKESIWQFAPDGTILMGNDTAIGRFGRTRDEIVGRHFQEFVSPELAVARQAMLRQAAETRKPVQFEDERAGIVFRHSFYPIFDPDGKVSSIASFSRDITEQKRREKELIQAHAEAEGKARDLEAITEKLQAMTEALETRVRERTSELADANEKLKADVAERVRLLAAIEQAREGVAIMESDGRMIYVNAAFEKLAGRDRSALSGLSYSRIVAERTGGAKLWDAIREALDRGEAWRGGMSRGGENGSALELEVTVSPIRDASGRVINSIAVERDVTQETRLQKQLRQAQKIEALGTLAGGIAHDFNNILNPIIINTELALLDADLDASLRRHLEVTLKAAERGRDLVKQVIAFSRQKERTRKPSKAGPVVEEAVRFLRHSLPSTIEIRAEIEAETGFILGDPAQIHQVVMNLSGNAAHAMRPKGGVLTVSLKELEVDEALAARIPGLKPGPYVRLAVSDTGIGMTAEVKERIFDPFFTTKAPGEGSGMGLPVVDGIVRNHGGAIAVESEAGQGSTFEVYFPRVEHAEPQPDAAPDGLPRGSGRVLLLDDEEVQVDTVRTMLEKLGYEVVATTSSREAIDIFRSAPRSFDVVITDQTMPHRTGLEVGMEILELRPGLPIVLCTGYSEAVDAGLARALGIREFLMKPYSISEMAAALKRILANG